MAARHYQITLPTAPAAAVRLSDVYGDGVSVINAAHDLPYRQIVLYLGDGDGAQADVYVGATPGTGSTDYGAELWKSYYLPLGPFNTGPLKLSDLYAVGRIANMVLHILAIPF